MTIRSMKALIGPMTLICLLLVNSCKKEKDTLDKTQLLTNGSWKLTTMTVEPAIDWFGTPVTNVYLQLPTCVKDDLTIFKSNGIINYDEGASKCNPNDPQTTTGTWTFNTDQTILSITTNGSSTESWDISELTDTRFEAEYPVIEEGVTYSFFVVFEKQ
ncbi:MAG TPA: DUF5004 domain-containing protein [Saprospiraceae bacterium]|nr:DUF5004 domain-containing protein [Saprospiraceae bacterium]HMQ83141.1 DUF5004 domain-containing protein [Saprospiraceae bacterium]